MNISVKSKSLVAMTIPFNQAVCEDCADRVKKVIKAIPGVKRTDIDLEKNQIAIAYDPDLLDSVDIQHAVSEIGYSFPTFTVVLNVAGMSCISCAARVEGALLNLPGVLDAVVSLTNANVKVTGIKAAASVSDMEQAIRSVGYQASRQAANDELNLEEVNLTSHVSV
jgi:Cu+-exporting ATPase